jgi:hypothetical protein
LTQASQQDNECNTKAKCIYRGQKQEIQQPEFLSLEVRNNNKSPRNDIAESVKILRVASKRQNSLVLKLKKIFQR